MSKLLSSYCIFLIWLIVFTCLLGALGALLPSLASKLILLPYACAFYLMSSRLIKRQQALPNQQQRIMLAIGCVVVFWVYSVLAGYLGLMLVQQTLHPEWGNIFYAFENQSFVTFIIAAFLFMNALLIGLSYWFLAKPAARILAQQAKSNPHD
jgi:lysylphosphatidylglycerol synthetase-like protein (DUF2156 family)